ncbi:hypothetical protein H0H81_002909 [Sphagnurus paluster]|uniref:Argonaute linker 2 domain-containing protein n=1 Tax=Sphagnurus paluster TaxID=117069 RepID=A0A9P7GMD1_9AGAR|nr:hypothetical protein H0H81_002909 [Sphagnurus paluster]
MRLRLFLKGVKVEVNLPGHAGKRSKTIKDVLSDVGSMKFEKEGAMVSIADHFAAVHNYRIRPQSLGVKLGSDGIFPMIAKNRASPEVVREALKFSPPDPQERLHAITAGWNELQYQSSPFLIGAGISVDPVPLQVHGRVLPPPSIRFGDVDKRQTVINLQRPGQWDMMRKLLYKPKVPKQWVVVDFASADRSTLERFIEGLVVEMQARGMSQGSPPYPKNIVQGSPSANIPEVLYRAASENNAQMILVILPESAPDPYRQVKRYGDITRGLVTQINAKLGGINFLPEDDIMKYLQSAPTMAQMFFPIQGKDGIDPKGNGNLLAGFTVDQDIIHPVHRDFYLQSQPGLKGNFSESHTFCAIAILEQQDRSRSQPQFTVSAPLILLAPLLKQLVCRRAKFHFSERVGEIDSMSVNSDESHHLDYFKAEFSAVNNSLMNTMYFV